MVTLSSSTTLTLLVRSSGLSWSTLTVERLRPLYRRQGRYHESHRERRERERGGGGGGGGESERERERERGREGENTIKSEYNL